MANDNAFSVGGVAIRLTRLTSTGALASGPSASYVTKKFVSLTFTPEYEDGDEFVTKAADGTICVTFRGPTTLKRVTLSIALCDPDPEFTEMISGGTLLSAGGSSVGWAAPGVGVNATPNGVAIEVWAKAGTNGKQTTTNPFWQYVFPYAQMHYSGDRVIQNDLLATNFEGWGVGNSGFGSGPAAPTWPYGADTPVAYARSASVPAGQGYQTSTPT